MLFILIFARGTCFLKENTSKNPGRKLREKFPGHLPHRERLAGVREPGN